MLGSSSKTAQRIDSPPEIEGSAEWLDALAHRLTREFNAPVGLFDTTRGVWLARHGAEPERFPSADVRLAATLASIGVGGDRVSVWQPVRVASPVWLALSVPMLAPGAGALVALVGFADAVDSADAAGWGPICPPRALRAWGQSVANQLRGESGPARTAPGGPGGGAERQFVARLIRRLKISDPPERFQGLATHALRSTLGVAAVAWVPSHHRERVIVGGEVSGLSANAYRTLIPTSACDLIQINNQPAARAGGTSDAALRRVIAIAADSQAATGWLVAVNPLDDREFGIAEVELLQPAASLIATQQANARVYADLKELLFGVIRALTSAIDAKDPYTSGHSERVARIAVRLGEELGMSANQRSDLYLMGLLHDVGKIGVDDSVLKKTGPLTPEEFKIIQSHVEIGVHILNDLKKLHHLLPGVKHHHESLDGTGYPSGLAGDQIPFEARILAVADSFDAMSSTRPYRKRLSPMKIDEILHKGSGVQWDSKIIDALFAARLDVEHIRQKGLGESLQIVINDTLGRA